MQEKKKLLDTYDRLHEQARLVIVKGARPRDDIEALIATLRGFVTKRPERTHDRALSDKQIKSLSGKFADIPNIPMRFQEYLRNLNIVLIAEIYLVSPRPDAEAMIRVQDDLLTLVQQTFDLPRRLDPVAAGWQPPYGATLERQISDIGLTEDTALSLKVLKISKIGQLVQWTSNELRSTRIHGRAFPKHYITELGNMLTSLNLRFGMPLPKQLLAQFAKAND